MRYVSLEMLKLDLPVKKLRFADSNIGGVLEFLLSATLFSTFTYWAS